MSKVRVCFLGTPEFAVTSLKALLEDEHFEVVGVVTQPDRPSGRKLQLTPSPVKVLAQAHNIQVLSPESLKAEPAVLEIIKTWGAEVAVVVAFGQILNEDFLKAFPFGAVNVHGSVLPRWRGAAPIQRAIEFGDSESGVTLQRVVKKLDAGDILGIRKVKITDTMNALQLHDELALLGADLLRVELMDYVRGNLGPVKQDEAFVTYAKKIEKAESLIDWNLSALQIDRKLRGFAYGPGVYTIFKSKKLKIHRTQVLHNKSSSTEKNQTGKILEITQEFISVSTGDGVLQIFELQPESRNRMQVREFLKANAIAIGDLFGETLEKQ